MVMDAATRFDHRNDLFPEEQDHALTKQFSITMRDLIGTSVAYRAYRDWKNVATDLTEPAIRFSFTRDFISMRNQWIPGRHGVYRNLLNRACSFHCAGSAFFCREWSYKVHTRGILQTHSINIENLLTTPPLLGFLSRYRPGNLQAPDFLSPYS